MASIKITSENFKDTVESSKKKVLLDFWADWCGPCKMVGPILEQISDERNDILVCKINVDEEPELANTFQISSIPTLIVMENGNILNRSSGARPKSQILAMLD